MTQQSFAINTVVLAGGGARRFGGRDKALLLVAGRPFLALILDDLARLCPSSERIVVGPVREGISPTGWTLEEPPGSGPLAGLHAGFRALTHQTEWTYVLACDAPFSVGALPLLAQSAATATAATSAVVAVDPDGRIQPLVALYRTTALQRAFATLTSSPDPTAAGGLHPAAGPGMAPGNATTLANRPLKHLLAELSVHEVVHEVALPEHLIQDFDTPEDFDTLQRGLNNSVN